MGCSELNNINRHIIVSLLSLTVLKDSHNQHRLIIPHNGLLEKSRLLLPPDSSQVGGGQNVTAPPPPGRSSLILGVRGEEQGYFLGGND